MIKILIAVNVVLILISLLSGLFFLSKDDKNQRGHMVKSLTMRVVLSFSLVILLLVAYFTGNLVPNQI